MSGGMQWGTAAGFPAVYEELMVPGFFAAFADELLDRAAPTEDERLLDVATGTGIVLRRARERVPGLARLTGLDLTPGMLAVARGRSEGLGIEYVEGDAQALPFEDDSFDVLTCQQGLQFFPEREQALAGFRRVLRPGGRAVVACWCEIESQPGYLAVAEVVARRLPDRAGAAHAPFALPDAATLSDLLEGAGFSGVTVERVEGLARFDSPEEFTRAFLEGSPMALALGDLSADDRVELTREIVEAVRERVRDSGVSPLATNIAVGRA
jgi:ubiquinone/menaquinone biosynthesis C-methylase UbiE